MLLLTKRNLNGIIATGFAENRLEVKLAGNRLIVFYGISENEHQNLLTSKNPFGYLDTLKTKFRFKDFGPILG